MSDFQREPQHHDTCELKLNQNDQKYAFDCFYEAIESIPSLEKMGYLDAKEMAPQLVEIESNPLLFLMYAKYNAWEAAKRFINYWEWRSVAFGDRAYLPLFDLSGKGALNDDDIRTLQDGYMARIPSHNSGCSVLFWDRLRLLHEDDVIKDQLKVLRQFFFVLSLCFEEQKYNPEPKYHVLWLHTKPAVALSSRGRNFGEVCSDVFPMHLEALDLLFLPKHTDPNSLIHWVATLVVSAIRTFLPSSTMRAHYSSNDTEMHKVLIGKLGFSSDRLPDSVGGTWTYVNYFENLVSHFSDKYSKQPSNNCKDGNGIETIEAEQLP